MPSSRSPSSRSLPSVLGFVLFACALGAAAPAAAQYRNNGIQLPSVGYMTMFEQDLVTQAIANNVEPLEFLKDWEWNSYGHVTLGTGYFRALGYNLWLDTQLAIGGSHASVWTALPAPVFSVHASTGLRYNIFDEEYRPFISAHVHYLQMFAPNTATLPVNEIAGVNLGLFQYFWVGARAGGGFEWFFLPTFRKLGVDIPIFYDEMSCQIEGNVAAFVNFRAPLVSGILRFSYNVYF